MNFRYILPMLVLLWLAIGTTSCIKEEFAEKYNSGNVSSVSIRVKLPEQTIVNPATRAEAAEFDELNNINILISDKGTIKQRIYLDFITNKWEDGTPFEFGIAKDGVTVTLENTGAYNEYHLEFSDNYLADIPVKTCEFHAIANWGEAIMSNTVSELRALQTHTNTQNLEGTDHSIVPTPNVMYGDIVSERSEVIDPANPAEIKRVVTVGLERTAAMITLAIDGTDLANTAVIRLESVTLHNVPNVCQLGRGNKATRSQIAQIGDFRGGMMLANGYQLVGKARQEAVSGYDEAGGYKTVIGGHYKTTNDNVSDVNDELVRPLFLFENMQGTGAAVDGLGQSMKRPIGVDPSEEAINRYNEESGVCSYIEVKATYTQYDPDNLMTVTGRGPVSWRFFLGSDAESDLNVKRNTNYQLTLKLNDTGIGEANSSWRVDADLKKPEVVGTPDMVVGGGGEMFCVELAGDLSNLITNGLKLSGTEADFVYVYTTAKGKLQWVQVSEISEKGNTHWGDAVVNDKQLWFYVQPLLPDDTYSGNERGCYVEFQSNNGTPQTRVTFTQYRPVTFSLKQDDLTKFQNDKDLQRAYFIIKEYYKHDVQTQGDFTFYADRVDRDAMPWGFAGVQLDKNQNTGFENVYHLIKPLDENRLPTCQGHIDYAAHYLPTGKGFREKDASQESGYSTYIDYQNGSCMMHAAMENYFQQYYPKPADAVKPADLISVTLEDVYRPGSKDDPTPTDRRYSWCVPSIAGCQLVEILDRFYKNNGITDRGFDPMYPISQWTSYWTSNAATADLKEKYPTLVPEIDGKNRSFIYQFGMGLDEIQEGDTYPARLLMPRASAIKYRLLNIRPSSTTNGGITN